MSLVYIASNFIRFLGEIPWEMLRALVQEHSLRRLFLGNNKFTVDTIPEVVGTMTELEALDLNGLGYAGKSGTPPVMSRSDDHGLFLLHFFSSQARYQVAWAS